MQDIVIRGLSKAFDGKQVLRDFSAVLPAGQVTGLMAPSGAVRRPLLRILMGWRHRTVEPSQDCRACA